MMWLLMMLACTSTIYFPPATVPTGDSWNQQGSDDGRFQEWTLKADCQANGLSASIWADSSVDAASILVHSDGGGLEHHPMAYSFNTEANNFALVATGEPNPDYLMSAQGVCASGGELSVGLRAYSEGRLTDCLVAGPAAGDVMMTLTESDPETAALGCRITNF